MRHLTPLVLLGLLACQGTGLLPSVPVHYDIGAVQREVTTGSPDAQRWFDRGLGLTYGFNHEEAVACFARAAQADPRCAMAYWGQAYALGPNYNAPEMDEAASRGAYDALQRALAEVEHAAPVEQALIRALEARYAWPAPADRAALDAAYADEMRRLRAAYPGDADVAALCAEALMQQRPWKLWSPAGEPAPETPEIRAVLEAGLARWPDHPALCHLYIHAMEAGPEAARAVPAAERLESLTPGLGHLVHMPSHIYTWTGRYADVVRVNIEAVQVDDAFVEHAGRDNFYTLYRLHNFHFVAYGAMFEGRRELALAYARRLVQEIPPGLLAAFPDFLDIFTATPYHVLVRFGLWEEILAEPEPATDELLAARAVWRYARGVALASLGRVEEAAREQVAFRAARAAVPETRLLFQNQVSDILSVADNVLAGELAYRRGDHERAFELLREAVRLDVALNYDEPWGWMEPAEHALGALLTEQGRHAEAVEVYRANLARYPENGWALHGLAESLGKLGHAREAADARARFERAWARADTQIPGSCFCRTRG
jgi:tetratricopeptide (TPR) repeat protein